MKHVPVLLNEVLKILAPSPRKFIIDGTVDGGGHSAEILEKISPGGTLLGIDLDKASIESLRQKIAANPKSKNQKSKLILSQGNYAELPEILKQKKLSKADGLLLDLGFSSEQLDAPAGGGKGFSFLKDEPLIMRYASTGFTAAEVINGSDEGKLADIFWQYGEERFSRRIARKIVEIRKRKRIVTTFDLVEAIRSAVPRSYEKGRIHPATRVFQALRIYLNNELCNLEAVLKSLHSILKPGGVAVVISFHSLEDRLVKNYFRELARRGLLQILTKKPVVPEKYEVLANPRSRSAKLRAAFIKVPKY